MDTAHEEGEQLFRGFIYFFGSLVRFFFRQDYVFFTVQDLRCDVQIVVTHTLPLII